MLLYEVKAHLDRMLNDIYVVDYTILQHGRLLASIMTFKLVVNIKAPDYLK